MPRSSGPLVVILFGVSGAGKTVVGSRLARELGWTFYDADSFHSPDSIDKMRRGIPLTDADRWPWLERLREKISQCLAAGGGAVLACSALKTAYRRYLGQDDRVKFVHLKGDEELIASRLRQRHDHYLDPELLRSQFEALEEPADQSALVLDVTPSPDELVEAIKKGLDLS